LSLEKGSKKAQITPWALAQKSSKKAQKAQKPQKTMSLGSKKLKVFGAILIFFELLWASLSFFHPKKGLFKLLWAWKRAFWASLSLKKGFLSFFEPRKGQFFWLWLKKVQNGSKKLKTAQKSSKRLKKAQKVWACQPLYILNLVRIDWQMTPVVKSAQFGPFFMVFAPHCVTPCHATTCAPNIVRV
jgi:hypothetical protein